tara:strand:- start:28 stop:447 length:420 start_codon:yes stop_codon:yes gene_type:complete
MRRVVVTGMGLLTSIGDDKETSWTNLINKKSGIKKIDQFDVSNLPAKIAGYINNNPENEYYFNKKSFLEPREINRNDRFIQYGLVAAKMAIDDAGLENISEDDKLRAGVSVGSGIGGLETIYEGSLTINNKEPKKLCLH